MLKLIKVRVCLLGSLEYAAKARHLNVCKLIIENVDNKHPKNIYGQTPMDLASQRYYVNKEVCDLFKS